MAAGIGPKVRKAASSVLIANPLNIVSTPEALAPAAAAVAMASSAKEARAESNASDILSQYNLADQYGKPFDAGQALGGKPFVLAFGFNGCLQCQKISNTLARVQEKLPKDVPIVVLSIHPEKDRQNMKEYVSRYNEVGVEQFRGEGQPASQERREELYDEGRNRGARERALHILTADSQQKAYAIHDQMKLIRQRSNDNSHSAFIMVCDSKGEVQKRYHAALDPQEDKAQIDLVASGVAATVRRLGAGRE